MNTNLKKLTLCHCLVHFAIASFAWGQNPDQSVLEQPAKDETTRSREFVPANEFDVFSTPERLGPVHETTMIAEPQVRYTSNQSCGFRRPNRLADSNSQFPVEEVQHGLNAGLPSFGYVSHGAWYSGETRELFKFSRCLHRFRFRKTMRPNASTAAADCKSCFGPAGKHEFDQLQSPR